jgi:ribokinase
MTSKYAVVGHVEVVEFVEVERVPAAGQIVHGTLALTVAAGGGAVAAVALARWAGEATLYCALGDDEHGRRAAAELRARGVDVRAAWRPVPQRRAMTLIDREHERTIVVIGERLVAHGSDRLGWDDVAGCDAVYITGGDVEALHHARAAKVAVATARILPLLQQAHVPLDALASSAADPAERYVTGELAPEPRVVVRTEGDRGGTYTVAAATQRYAAVPTKVTGDTYGAGDTFAAALAFGLGRELPVDVAVGEAARRAAEVLAWRGPYPPDSTAPIGN